MKRFVVLLICSAVFGTCLGVGVGFNRDGLAGRVAGTDAVAEHRLDGDGEGTAEDLDGGGDHATHPAPP